MLLLTPRRLIPVRAGQQKHEFSGSNVEVKFVFALEEQESRHPGGVCLCLRILCPSAPPQLQLSSLCIPVMTQLHHQTAESKSSIRKAEPQSDSSCNIPTRLDVMNIHTELIIHEGLLHADAGPAHKPGVSNRACTLADGVSFPNQETLTCLHPERYLNPMFLPFIKAIKPLQICLG